MHPSLIIWCGNNEMEWGAWHWGGYDRDVVYPDHALLIFIPAAIGYATRSSNVRKSSQHICYFGEKL